ncbi:DNA adenine methylase [Scytonema hofmannii FACHB-248]|uniref:Site-specific DNA-methyltransferase (adenine-specific) n=1 Tax=Scytonema hofmannii FACHB-248 TaxID=1842502 RepID=A0ABR8GTG0_9CYAN|nr:MULTISPECIES: DNA adenine methylase [Nostocales]MBD2606702.1 DNA adenine methylase [Scytonema hofmannii FACHB-248]
MLSQSKSTLPRPFLKWAGGKSKLIKQYLTHLPSENTYKNYYEPFLGGGAIFFHIQPSKAILTDINTELITTYRCVRDNIQKLISLLKEHESKHSRDYYYSVRANPGKTDLEKAARLIYLNKTCFNGLYRVNSQGKFNVPLGKYKNPNICPEDLLIAASKALYQAEIKSANFTEILNHATSSDDFVYFDPPYYPISETSYFTSYTNYSFKENQQIQLRDIFVTLSERGVKVMLSNSDCEFIRNLYSGFNIHTISAARAINSNAKKRGKINEILVTSY